MSGRALALVPLLALLGCSGSSTGPQADRGTRDTLVVASQGDIGSLLSVTQSSAFDSNILGNLNFPYVRASFDCTIKKEPALITDWNWSADGKVLSLTIRDDIHFADGVRVDAHDIAFTYEVLADPAVATPRSNALHKMVPGKAPKVISDTQLEFHFTEAYDRDSQFSHATIVDPLPRHLLADADRGTLRGHAFGKNPVVTGPWKIDRHEPNSRLVIVPNENFTGPESYHPKLNRVIFKIVPEYSTRLLELQNGQVDMMEGILVADADLLRRNNPDINLVRRGWRASDYVAWNLSNPLFADPQVRHALAMAANVDHMIERLLTSETGEVYARRSVGTVTPELCGVHNDDITPLPFDRDAAKELLAQAGWVDTTGDGYLNKDGKTFEFTLMTNTGNERRLRAAEMLQSSFREVGVRVNLERLEFNTMTDRLTRRDFDAVLSGWAAGLTVDPSAIWRSDQPERRTQFNYPGYSNPRVDELIDKGLSTPDPMEAAPIWRELQQHIYEDQPYLFLWWMDEIVGIDSRFTNTHIDVLSSLHNLHEWEVPPDRVKYAR